MIVRGMVTQQARIQPWRPQNQHFVRVFAVSAPQTATKVVTNPFSQLFNMRTRVVAVILLGLLEIKCMGLWPSSAMLVALKLLEPKWLRMGSVGPKQYDT